MSLTSDEMQELLDAGTTPEQLVMFSKILERRQEIIDHKRTVERERKRKQRELALECHGTVTGQSQDKPELSQDNPSSSSMVSPIPPSLASSSPHKEKPPKGVKKKKPIIPDWIPAEYWDDYVEMRKSIGKKMTEKAVPLAISKLERLRIDGHDPGEVLKQSILNSYQGLFAVRDEQNGKQTKSQRIIEAGERIKQKRREDSALQLSAITGQAN